MLKRKMAMVLVLFTLALPAAQANGINLVKDKTAMTKEITMQKDYFCGTTKVSTEKNDKTLVEKKDKTLVEKKDKTLEVQSVKGHVVDINKNKDSINVSVQQKETPNPLDGQIIFTINNKTEIIDEASGKKLNRKDIKDGMNIKVYHDPVMTLSLPPMGYAKKVIVLKTQQENLSEVKGNIVDVNKNKGDIMVTIQEKKTPNSLDGQFVFAIDSKTEIIDQASGKKLNRKDIKYGMNIKVYHTGAMTFSLPPIGYAKKVVVISDVKKDLLGTDGNITNISNNKNRKTLLIEGEKSTEFGYDKIQLNIDKNTKIFKEDGTKLSYTDLKPGMFVKTYYGPKVTRSLPPIGTAEKIVVIDIKNDVVNKPEKELLGTDGNITNISNNKNRKTLLIEGEKSSEFGYDKISLNINKNTKIFKEDGTKLSYTDLKSGMFVKAYYGPFVTRSLPPIGTAEKIVVLDASNLKEGVEIEAFGELLHEGNTFTIIAEKAVIKE